MGAGRPRKGQETGSGEQSDFSGKQSERHTYVTQFKLPTPKPEEKKDEPKK